MKKLLQEPPSGYSMVCPFLMVPDIEKEIEFLTIVFGCSIKEKLKGPDGNIHHAEIRIGECVIMIGRSRPDFPDKSMNYVFVSDADEVYRTALQHGASGLMEPADRFYGLREGGFADKEGNQWWIATLVENMTDEEMQKRAHSAEGFKSA